MLQNVFQPHASLFPDHRRRERHHRLRLARRPRERESIAVRESFPLVLVRARPQIFPPRPHQPVKLQRVRRPRALPSVRLRALRRHRARARHRARRSRRRALHDDVVRAGVRARPRFRHRFRFRRVVVARASRRRSSDARGALASVASIRVDSRSRARDRARRRHSNRRATRSVGIASRGDSIRVALERRRVLATRAR